MWMAGLLDTGDKSAAGVAEHEIGDQEEDRQHDGAGPNDPQEAGLLGAQTRVAGNAMDNRLHVRVGCMRLRRR